MTGGPMVKLGTKCPSITSTWIRSAPAASTRPISSARRAKSAARIDGAICITGLSLLWCVPMAKAGYEYSLRAALFWRHIESAGAHCGPWKLGCDLMVNGIKPHIWMFGQKTLYHLVRFFWLIRAHTVH